MSKIVAIGGGEIGRPGYPVETTKIDKEIIKLTGKVNPRLLFIPTASSDLESYLNVVKKHFGKRLNCKVSVLYLIREKLNKEEVEKKILDTDIIYVGGGNTLTMMKIWRKLGVDKVLVKAYKKDIVLSGLSAGAICWFRYGSSDPKPDVDPTKIRGLDFVNALYCPHYNIEKDRKADLKKMMKKTPGIAIAVDNCCAIEIVDGEYRVISSKKNANAYKVYWKRGKFHEELIEKKKEFMPIETLLSKWEAQI